MTDCKLAYSGCISHFIRLFYLENRGAATPLSPIFGVFLKSIRLFYQEFQIIILFAQAVQASIGSMRCRGTKENAAKYSLDGILISCDKQ